MACSQLTSLSLSASSSAVESSFLRRARLANHPHATEIQHKYRETTALMEHACKPTEDNMVDWNPYVHAMIAFIRRDRAALKRARDSLTAVPPTVGVGVLPVIDGYMEADFDDGSKRSIRCP